MKKKKLPVEVAWINNPVFHKISIYEEAFPLMKSHSKFAKIIGSHNRGGLVKKELTPGELEEFNFVKQDVKEALMKKDFRFIKIQNFIENYFIQELEKIGVEHSTKFKFVRNLLRKGFNNYKFNKAYNNAVKQLFK